MNKTRISEDIIEEIKQSKIDSKKLKILNIDIDNKKNLKELKQFLDENKKLLKNGLYDYCLEEYREIKDDLKFLSTKEGKLIIEIENWVQETRTSLSTLMPSLIFVGRSFFDPKKLVIGGLLNGNEETRIIEFFEERNPPVKPDYQFENSNKTMGKVRKIRS